MKQKNGAERSVKRNGSAVVVSPLRMCLCRCQALSVTSGCPFLNKKTFTMCQ